MGKFIRMITANKRSKLIFILSFTVVMIVSFTLVLSTYLQKFSNRLTEENSAYLSEIVDHVAVNMQTVIGDMQASLELLGMTLLKDAEDGIDTNYLSIIQKKYGFEYVGYAGADGYMKDTISTEPLDVSKENYFKKAIKGESVIQHIPQKVLMDKAISALVMAVPVYENSDKSIDAKGVIVAVIDINSFSEYVTINNFKGQGHTYIIDKKGETILYTKRMGYGNFYTALRNNQFSNNYSVDRMVDDLAGHGSGFSSYSDFGTEKFMYYKYLGVDSWSIVMVVEGSVITAKTAQLKRELMIVGLCIIVLFPILLIFAATSYEFSKSQTQVAEAKTAFLANMSHEIRTPMNAIVGISEILLRENLTIQQKNYVLSIVSAGNGLLTIINDILDVSKIESGKFSIVEEEYELESLVHDIITIVSIKLGDKPIEFLVDLDPTLPKYLTGDMIRVKQVLLNIIGNAIKFTKEGYIRFGIKIASVSGSKMEFVMPVQDTGVGIQKKDINKLFASFTQVDTHKNHSLEGTGLGLVISKRLCEMMGGSVSVESEYEKGSLFTVSVVQTVTKPQRMLYVSRTHDFRIIMFETSDILREYFKSCIEKMRLECDVFTEYEPFVDRLKMGVYTHVLVNSKTYDRLKKEQLSRTKMHFIAVLNLKEQIKSENYEMSIIVPLFTMQLTAILYNRTREPYLIKRAGGMDILSIQPMPFVKILLVDDNEVNIQVANGLMLPYQMHVEYAFSGASAIELIKERNYDLVFMDHMMPEMDGVEATRIIRSLDDKVKNSIVIVALTANVTQDARELFRESGFNDFLSKPIDTVNLNIVLKKWLKEKNDIYAKNNPNEFKRFQKKVLEDSGTVDVMAQVRNKVGTYINFSAGMQSLGSSEVYCNILSTYHRSVGEKMGQLSNLLESDIKNFIIEIHGIKGASLGISAEPIAKMAAELEQQSKLGEVEYIREELPEFLKELEKALNEIRLFVEGYKVKKSEISDNIQKENKSGRLELEVLLSFKEAFFDFDTERLKTLIESLNKFSYEGREKDLISKLNECYNSYDFDKPCSLIDEYINKE